MPKIFALRHQLAEQQAKLTGDIKTRLSPLQDEVKHTQTLTLPITTETKLLLRCNTNLWILIRMYGLVLYLCCSWRM